MYKRIVRFFAILPKVWKLVSTTNKVQLADGTHYVEESAVVIDEEIFALKQKQGIYPFEGRKVEITWFPDNNGERNAYIGMSGVVKNLCIDGSFELEGETSVLMVGPDRYGRNPGYKFVYL